MGNKNKNYKYGLRCYCKKCTHNYKEKLSKLKV